MSNIPLPLIICKVNKLFIVDVKHNNIIYIYIYIYIYTHKYILFQKIKITLVSEASSFNQCKNIETKSLK